MDYNLSIVIPCKNEGNGLIETLMSIKDIEKYQIIIADCSTDNTRELIKNYNKSISVVDGGLPSVGRNKGASLCSSEFLLFIDADMDLSNLCLSELLLDFKNNNLNLATCRITVSGFFYKIPYFIFYLVQNIISIKTPFAVGGFMLFKKSEFDRLNGFNEDDKFAEDYHLSMKVDPKKFKIYNKTILTSNRRLKNKSIFYIIKVMTRCWINRNNDDFYKNDYDYWK